MSEFMHVRPSVAPVEQRTAAIEAAFDERGLKPARVHRAVRAPHRRAMGAAQRRARGRQGVDRSGFQAPAAGQRARRGAGARPHDAGAPPPPGGAGEHAHAAQRHLLHAVLVHRVHDHRPAARLVQRPRVPLAHRAPVAHGAEGDGARPAARGRDPRLGHHRRHPLHGAAGAAARTRWAGPKNKLAGIVTQRVDDRRGAPARSRKHGRHARPRRQAGLRPRCATR